MQPENGWFQLESQPPVKSAATDNKRIISSWPAERPNQPKAGAAVNTSPYGHTYAPNSPAENQPANRTPPAQQNANLTMTRMPCATGDRKAPAAPDENRRPAVPNAPNAAMEQKSTPKENAPDNVKQWASFNWADDMALHTRHAQTVGARGPVVLQDSILHEALEIFIHAKIPERPVHTKGFGAFGSFQTTNSMSEYTALPFLQSPGQQVPVMVRFSFAVSTKGTPDTARNVRGFSTKFYAREGVFDLLCNHIPVLFVRDGIRFPEAITSLAPSPVSNLIDPNRFWEFVARAPEAIHFITWLYSDVGTVKSFRHINGHSVNTYVWKNADGVRRYVKYHWAPLAGEETIDREEATRLAGLNPDIAGQDLYDAIASGHPVQYELRVQLMDPQDEASLPYDPLDCTKVWDEQQYPMIPVGRMTLNRNPDNFMEQVEKVAFSPTNLLDGAELSDDKLLQARANIYWDSQRHRLGEDFRSIPVNDQKNWTPDDLITSGAGLHVEGQLVRSELPDPDNFSQAGQRYLFLSAAQQDHLVDNLAADLALVSPSVRNVILTYLSTASEELGRRVAEQITVYMNR